MQLQRSFPFPSLSRCDTHVHSNHDHTPGHIDCPGCAKALAMLVSPLSASMRFSEAAQAFLDSLATLDDHGRIRYIAGRTHKDYKYQLALAGQFFDQLELGRIHIGHFKEYQRRRSSGEGFVRRVGGRRKGWMEVPTAAGPKRINDELGLVRRILEAANLWTPQLNYLYRELSEPESEIPKALSPVEQEHFLKTAASNTEWHVIWWYSLVVLDTTFSSDEMRTLRQGDINLAQRVLSVNRQHGKNKYRRRTVPIEDADCLWALERLLERSYELVGRSPAFYLFPIRRGRRYYGDSPISPTGLRKPFEAVRDRAGLPWFCINGLRHTAISRMAEEGEAIATIMRRAGHTTPKMTDHYTHISEQAERAMLSRRWDKKHPRPVTDIAQARLHHSYA
jgi:integrase